MVELQNALEEEIHYLQELKQRSSYIFYDGLLLSTFNRDTGNGNKVTVGYYRFGNKQLINLAPDTGAVFKLGGDNYRGFIIFCDRYNIEVSIESCTDIKIDSVSVEIESWRLLEIQKERLSKLNQNSILISLKNEHEITSPETSDYVYGQQNAINRAKTNPITVIWGPPGTGKTYTLAKIALSEAKAGNRVLILSQSNMAVDSAILQIKKVLDESINPADDKNKKVLRYGMVKSPDLLQYRHLLSWDAAFASRPDLKSQYKNYSDKLLDVSTLAPHLINALNNARKQILSEINTIELDLVRKAKIVAMTATKATISKDIYDQNWDTVIFDEISMAYISQVMIAASLAKKKLVLVGDFKQLAPIVQNPNGESLLRKDIFSYIHITDGNRVRKHRWLVMLNIQWRMHPDIAAFANSHSYNNKLQTAQLSTVATTEIKNKGPFPNSSFAYINFADYKSTCFSTGNGSRFNLFSATLSVKIALEALEKGQTDIGIVTPYAAQSQIINAILRDIEEAVDCELPIFCATIHQFQGSERDVIIFDSVESFPKRQTGKILSQDDSTMRLINVALTRARGKFILLGNDNYIHAHRQNYSSDFLDLIRESKAEVYQAGEDIEPLLFKEIKSSTMRFFPSSASAMSTFRADLLKCNQKIDGKFIEYWHSPNNIFLANSQYSFVNLINDSKKAAGYKRIYTSDNGVKQILSTSALPRKNIRDSNAAMEDDFVIINDTSSPDAPKILWLNMINVYSNGNSGKSLLGRRE